jgi:SET domain-containing protein 6
MGSLIMAYAFHNENEDEEEEEEEEEDEDAMEEDKKGEEQEPKVSVSMVPMADMLNHKTGHNNARLFHEKDCLRMVAIKNIPTGQQIYNTYGDLCNADLLRKYGFVDVPNPHNIVEISGEVVVAKCRQGLEEGKEEIVEWLLEQDALEE